MKCSYLSQQPWLNYFKRKNRLCSRDCMQEKVEFVLLCSERLLSGTGHNKGDNRTSVEKYFRFQWMNYRSIPKGTVPEVIRFSFFFLNCV